MLFESNVPNFDGFGVIANSAFPLPEAFIIKDIANQNTFNNSFDENEYKHFHYSGYYNHNDFLCHQEDDDDDYDENDEYDDYDEYDEEKCDE